MHFVKYSIIFLTAFGVTLALGFEYFKLGDREENISIPFFRQPSPTLAFSLEDAPSDALKGTITKMAGDISWQSRVATEAAKITSPRTIQQGENLITGDKSSLSLNFPDVCSIDMSENTEVDVIQTLPANVVFSQTAGTATYSKLGASPVSIRTKYLLTNIEGEVTLSYDQDKPVIILTINSGSAVVAYNDKKYISHEVNLSKGKTYTFNYETRKGVAK